MLLRRLIYQIWARTPLLWHRRRTRQRRHPSIASQLVAQGIGGLKADGEVHGLSSRRPKGVLLLKEALRLLADAQCSLVVEAPPFYVRSHAT